MADWKAVFTQALEAAKAVLSDNWKAVAAGAEHSIALLTQTAQYIVLNPGISDVERKMLIDNQKLAMKNVLLGYEDVGILVAEQAVAAAWDVISKALSDALELP
jgi:hypothetical protein